MKANRLARVAEAVRESASETILFELSDPRVKGVTVTRTEVSGDLQHAKVFVSIMGSPQEQKLCLHGLKHASGYIQSRVAGRLKSRFTPVITFVLDQGVKKSIEVSRLIKEALAHPANEPAGPRPADGTAEEESADSQ
jgi:ribosome-binding factor A